jgi:hypothetical protein
MRASFSTALVLAFIGMLASPGHTQAPPPIGPPIGQWSVADDGETTLASNITQATTYRVENKGPDNSVTVVVRNADNVEVDHVSLAHGDTVDVGVPAGGDLMIRDMTDSNAFGATGTYKNL